LSQDAAIVLALARTAVPFAPTREEQAERWVRTLRLHGQVGVAMQALGVGEAPLESPAGPRPIRLLPGRLSGERAVDAVEQRAVQLAAERGAESVGTIDVFFSVLDAYGSALERALYMRGTTRQELLAHLAMSGHALPEPFTAA
jgi:hypothetical protein